MCDLWSIFFSFSKCFEQSTSWCFASHFFVARSHQFIANCHPHFLAPFLKGKAWKENFFVNFSLCTTSCSTLARHPLKFATLLLIHFVQVIPEPVVLSWRLDVTWSRPVIFSCRRRSCLKRRVCFHSNQYFYVPQENVNVSNEQRVC